MAADEGKRSKGETWATRTVPSDSVILDQALVADSLAREPLNPAVFNAARGILNGLALGFVCWLVILTLVLALLR